MMTATEMIDRYRIGLVFDGGKPNGMIRCWNAASKKAQAEIKARKPEIFAELMARYEAKERAYAEKQAKIDAIKGLKEMRENEYAQLRWQYEFNRCMEDENASSCPPTCPKDRSAELAEMYPRAAAYLKSERDANSANYEISAIGKQAMEKILNGEDHNKVLAEMQKEHEEFVSRHMWD